MAKTFLFDLGRVLLDFNFEPSLAKLLPGNLPDADERMTRLMERKDEFEAGKITPDDYTRWALETLGSQATPAEFQHAWQHIFTPNEPMLQCVRLLIEQGHRLILFSNINAIHCPWVFENFPQLTHFDGAVLSYQTGYIKPQPEIYHHAIREYNLIPSETFYIDDLAPNIAAGRELGFRCYQYDLNQHSAFEQWLAANLAL